MSEIELKIMTDAQGCDTVWERAVAAGLCADIPEAGIIESTYFDTADRVLEKAGISLRLRSKNRAWLQTVKHGRKLRSGLSRVTEIEVPVDGPSVDFEALPDEDLRDRLRTLVAGAPIAPVTSTQMSRRAGDLTLADGARIELAADVGEIVAGTERRPFCEIEFELIAGEPAALFDAAQAILPDGILRFSRLSKGARGLLLADTGEIEPKPSPRRARTVPLARDEPVGEAVRATLRECLDQIALNLIVVSGADAPEGPHQLRVGLRRLRSMLSVYGKALAGEQTSRLAHEAKWLAAEVGRLRDVDAVVGDIVKPLAEGNGEPGFPLLLAALAEEAAARRETLRQTLASRRVRDFLLDLARQVETADADAGGSPPLARHAAAILDKRWRRVEKSARGIATLDIARRHELRKDLKRLRYAVEFFAPLFETGKDGARRVTRFIRCLKELQDIMGDVIDASVAEALMEETGLKRRPDPELQRAVGWTIGAARARAEASWLNAAARWKGLAKAKRFW